jgi:hypothetical protein
MANGASRIDSSGQAMAGVVLPPIPFVPTPAGSKVVTSDALAEWNKQHHKAMQEWLEKLNTILQRTG